NGQTATSTKPTQSLLDVRSMTTHFSTPRGVVRAVDGVSFTLQAGEMLGIVGESGSGKTVLSRSILGLTPKSAIAEARGEVLFEGRDLRKLSESDMRKVRGREISMIFQDPMTALNPVMKIGVQIAESLRYHFDMSKRDARARAIELLRQVRIPSPERRVDE